MRWTGTVDGRIEVRLKYENGRVIPVEHKLSGGPIVSIGRELLDEDRPTRVFAVGPFLLYPLDVDYARDSIIAAHINGPLWWLSVLRYWASSIKPRVLATLYVWDLADHPMERTQNWDDVYLVRWLKRKVRHA